MHKDNKKALQKQGGVWLFFDSKCYISIVI